MALLWDTFAQGIAALEALLLDALSDDGARLTLGPILQGPISKGEVQVFYLGSRNSAPDQLSFNNPWKQIRTIEFRANILLKNLRDQNAAVPLVELVKRQVTGCQLFGASDAIVYAGGLYPVSDRFTRLNDEAFWYYEMTLACQVEEFLPVPYVYEHPPHPPHPPHP